MTQFLNVGGDLIDLYADYEYARQDSSDRARDRRDDLRTLAKTARVISDISPSGPGRYETIGGTVGLGMGIVYGYATLPVVVVDGPLPIFDMAWAYSTARFTKKSVDAGRKFGKQFD